MLAQRQYFAREGTIIHTWWSKENGGKVLEFLLLDFKL